MNAVMKSSNDVIDVSTGYRVDPHRGGHNGALSSQWFSRPADQRFTSLAELYDFTRARSDRSFARNLDTRDLRVVASLDDAERLRLEGPGLPVETET